MRDGNPANKQNWKLVCTACGAEFEMTETINLANGHFQEEHPDLEMPHFSMMWCGKGPKPKGGYRSARKGRRR